MILPAAARYLGELSQAPSSKGINAICQKVSGLADSLVDAIEALEHAQHEAHEAGSVKAEATAFATEVIPAQARPARRSSTSSRRSSPTTSGRCPSTASCSSSTEAPRTAALGRRPTRFRAFHGGAHVGHDVPSNDAQLLEGSSRHGYTHPRRYRFRRPRGRRLDRLRRLRLPERPKFGRNAWLWTIICLIFGPLGLMVLYVLPKQRAGDSGTRAPAHKKAATRRTPSTRSPRRSTERPGGDPNLRRRARLPPRYLDARL